MGCFIKNKRELSKGAKRELLLEVLEWGLKAADPVDSVSKALMSIKGELEEASRVFVVGFGKASQAMAKGCEEILGDLIRGGTVIAPVGAPRLQLRRIRVLEADHPIPSPRSVEAAQALLSSLPSLNEADTVICLASGGGSALLTMPAEGVTLADKQRVVELLLRAGANIMEINTVRKHISKVKGGLLARALAPARVISLILSDVVGDPIDVIASGPTAPDPTTFLDAKEVLVKYGLWDRIPDSVRQRILKGMAGEVAETPKPGDRTFDKVRNIVVANNMKALLAMEERARELGHNALVLTSFLEGEAREAGKMIAAVVKQVSAYDTPVRKPAALILGGETTVTVRGRGKGGRNQELALSFAVSAIGLKDFVLAAIGSDGIDGPTDAAGAVVDDTTLERAASLRLNPWAYLEENDSYNFFKPLGDLLYTGPTGTNVNDLVVALIN